MSSPIPSALTPTRSFDPGMLEIKSIRALENFDAEMLGIKQIGFFLPS